MVNKNPASSFSGLTDSGEILIENEQWTLLFYQHGFLFHANSVKFVLFRINKVQAADVYS